MTSRFDVEPKHTETKPRDWYGQWQATQEENAALRELLREWYVLFAPVRREGTEGAQLLDRTKRALLTRFQYVGQNVELRSDEAGRPKASLSNAELGR